VSLRVAILAAFVVMLVPASARAQGDGRELRVVQANVGNSNVLGCNDQVFKLCLRPVEERGAAALRALDPDLVTFQEILPAAICAQAPSPNPFNLCSGPLEPPSQVVRLLGDGYAETCDDRFGWDCVAARRGRVALGPVATLPVLDVCADRGFTVNVGTVRVGGWPIAVTNAHPHSTDAACRTAQLREMFERALPAAGPALVLGDFNLDPYREDDESVRLWKEKVPSEFRYASTDAISFALGPSQLDPTGQTLDSGADLVSRCTLDHVVLRGDLHGSCEPQRIDGGGGMDHLAQVCRISVGPGAAPRFSLRRRGCTVTARLEPRPAHLEAVEFRAGTRRVLDRRAPFRIRLRSGARRQTVRAVPQLATGSGPARQARVPARCAKAAAAPDRGRPAPNFTG
jgi:endonuclease/exonuclease/phosphatase family metal-dependent hydrolase